MYPESVIASWDALIPLLDAENIEWRVQLDAEKKSNVYANYKLQGKKKRHTIRKFMFRENNNFYQLIDSSVTVYFAVNFQTKTEKPLFSHHFPQSLMLSLLCSNSSIGMFIVSEMTENPTAKYEKLISCEPVD